LERVACFGTVADEPHEFAAATDSTETPCVTFEAARVTFEAVSTDHASNAGLGAKIVNANAVETIAAIVDVFLAVVARPSPTRTAEFFAASISERSAVHVRLGDTVQG